MNNPRSLLEGLRQKSLKDYEQVVENAPPISRALLDHMNKMFVAPEVPPSDPQIKEKLLFQHGIERVLNYMRGLHDRQERAAKEQYSKE
jgi:hypothetical protein